MSSHDGPREFLLGGKRVADVRHLFPTSGPAGRARDFERLIGIAVHHDGVIMEPGDRNYSGSTLDEDLQRLQSHYNTGLNRGWGGYPYHVVASPNGRVFYTLDLSCLGAHVARRNHLAVGVCLMGYFMTESPTTVQLCAAGLAIAAIRYELRRIVDIDPHREWALPAFVTACCGDTWPIWRDRLIQFANLHTG